LGYTHKGMENEVTHILDQLKGYLRYAEVLGISELPRTTEEEPLTPVQVSEASLQLKAIREEMGDCQRCPLGSTRKNLVFGDGNPQAQLVFVGEAPGSDEDEQGVPFVGRAGQLLNRALEMVGLGREEVYIANILKCRPPNNRAPEPSEISVCMPFLLKQLEAIRPKLVCALGAVAMNTLMGRKMPITKVRGSVLTTPHGYTLVPIFHPAYILRNPREKRRFIQDLQTIKEMVRQ